MLLLNKCYYNTSGLFEPVLANASIYPAVTIIENILCVAVRGSDGTSLWQSSIDLATSTFSGWTRLSGSTPSKPTLTS